LLIGSSGNPPSVNTITGTTNRVIVSNAPGSITLSTPQDIATTSQPTFDRINVRNGSQQLLLGDATNWMSITASSGAAPRQFTIPNPDSGTTGTFAILERAQTFTGTITLSSTISTGNISFDSTKGIESRTSGGTLNVGTGGNTSTLNLGSGDSVATINVGTGTSAATVNIGNSSADTINLSGTLNVQDKNILLNDGGAASSGDGSGLDVEENNAVTGYARVGDTRTAWDFKAPANAGFIRLKTGPQNAIISATGLLAARTYTLPDATGTFGLVPTSGVVKSNGTALTSGSVNLASEVSGVLPTANGGTGVNGTATYPSTGTVVTAEGSATLSLKTLQDALYQGIRLVDNNVTAAGPSFAVSNTVSIYRVKSGFGATLSTITSGNDGTFIFVVNETGGDLTITNNAGTNGLYTGTGSNLVLQNNSAVACVYDTTNARWNITGGGGGGGPAILPIASGGTNSGTALLNNRVMISSGGAIIEASAIQADRALVSNAQGIPVASAITLTELNRLTGVSSDIQTQLDGKQASDADLTALAGLTSTGLIVRTGAGTAATRSLAAGTGKISISNVDGVAGNPTIDVVEGNLTHNNIGGILGLAKGGTNANITPAAGAIVFSTATALGVTAAGTAGQPLISNGTSTPTWFSGTGFVKATTGVLSTVSQVSLTTEVTGTLPVANGGTGSTTSTGSAGSAVVLATSPTITDAQLSSVRLTDTTISTAGPAFTVGTSTTYRLLSGFGSTLSTISGGQDGDFIIIVNETNNDLTITNNAGVNGLFTGTGANLVIQNSAAVTGVYDSGNQRWNLISGGGAGGLRTSVVTGNTNAVAGVHYLVNNTAAVTITLPASPQTEAVIRVSDLKGTCGTNNITIARNGQLIDGQAENFVLDVNNGWAQLMWAGGSEGWTVDTLAVGANLPVNVVTTSDVQTITAAKTFNAALIAAGGGITFPSSANLSSDANTLDDYEEGTWTPSFSPASGSFSTMTYSTRIGQYTRIGRTVICLGQIATSNVSIGTASGELFIVGLPFTVVTSAGIGCTGFLRRFTGTTVVSPGLQGGTSGTSIAIAQNTASSTADPYFFQVSNLTTGAATFRNEINFMFIYTTTVA
jgi:hypothetical protein